jgi:hypothetical protein
LHGNILSIIVQRPDFQLILPLITATDKSKIDFIIITTTTTTTTTIIIIIIIITTFLFISTWDGNLSVPF